MSSNTRTSSTAAAVLIHHSCGHDAHRDLSFKKPFEQAGFAAWLTTKACRDCDPKEKARRSTWLTGRRAQEQAAATATEQRFALTPLTGPDKIQPWATRIRADLITAAWDALDLDEDEFTALVAEPAAEVDTAGWWLENKDTTPEELPAALTEPGADTGTQNPF